jgi:hypothetical protein
VRLHPVAVGVGRMGISCSNLLCFSVPPWLVPRNVMLGYY